MSPETLAAQALGETDPVTGALAPVINLATNYKQHPDGSHPQGRAYTRADNPTSEHAERLLAALRAAGARARCSAQAWGPRRPRSSRCCLVSTWWSPGSCTGKCASGWPEFALTWGLDVEFTDTTDLDTLAAAIRLGRTRLLWVETPADKARQRQRWAAAGVAQLPFQIVPGQARTLPSRRLRRPSDFHA